MAGSKDRNLSTGKTPTVSSWNQTRVLYLTAYNSLFVVLWSWILFNAIRNSTKEKHELFLATEPRARWTQTAALVEVLHAALGIIPSPVSTTALQVVTRVIQVWMIWYGFPESTSESHAYLALLLAWSIADVIRYAYLAVNLHAKPPKAMVWLRYTMFYPLYPIGIGAEWWLLYRAITPGGRIAGWIPPLFYFFLMLYIPGSYTMFTYMIKQRKKIFGRRQKEA